VIVSSGPDPCQSSPCPGCAGGHAEGWPPAQAVGHLHLNRSTSEDREQFEAIFGAGWKIAARNGLAEPLTEARRCGAVGYPLFVRQLRAGRGRAMEWSSMNELKPLHGGGPCRWSHRHPVVIDQLPAERVEVDVGCPRDGGRW